MIYVLLLYCILTFLCWAVCDDLAEAMFAAAVIEIVMAMVFLLIMVAASGILTLAHAVNS